MVEHFMIYFNILLQ